LQNAPWQQQQPGGFGGFPPRPPQIQQNLAPPQVKRLTNFPVSNGQAEFCIIIIQFQVRDNGIGQLPYILAY